MGPPHPIITESDLSIKSKSQNEMGLGDGFAGLIQRVQET